MLKVFSCFKYRRLFDIRNCFEKSETKKNSEEYQGKKLKHCVNSFLSLNKILSMY